MVGEEKKKREKSDTDLLAIDNEALRGSLSNIMTNSLLKAGAKLSGGVSFQRCLEICLHCSYAGGLLVCFWTRLNDYHISFIISCGLRK